METSFFVSLLLTSLLFGNARSLTFSYRLIHRFSDEANALRISRGGDLSHTWPRRSSVDYYQMLAQRDVRRQKMKFTKYPSLFPLEGSETVAPGNDFGWLHYTWIDIGTPNVPFLVALDTGSDLFWVPCDCIQCAPLSANYYNGLDRDLSMYSLSESRTSKPLSCSNELCALGPNCKSPNQRCPYIVDYYSENTSSSGLLVEDILYLLSSDRHALNDTVQTPVIVGCGRMQSGGLDGLAPDGVLGLGFGDISVPSFLAKAGLVQNSFSICFDEDGNGRIFIGDQGKSTQQSTSFLAWEGKYIHYIVGVDRFCIGTVCLKQTSFKTLIDSGSSFTILPDDVYERVTMEFDRQMNASRFSPDGVPWKYCYKASSLDLPEIPAVALMFAGNNSYVVRNPIFPLPGNKGELVGFCLALQPAADDVGIIGQNYMMGYHIVFDRENMKLRWSTANCHDVNEGNRAPLTSPPHKGLENQLPANEQQNSHGSNAVSPAVAGRTPQNHAAASMTVVPWRVFSPGFLLLLMLLLVL